MNFKLIDFILLIPCYNNTDGLKKSINSIDYPADKFEILIVDDGSTQPISITDLIVINPNFAIKIIRLKSNQGIVYALNTGLQLLKKRDDFKYIARLDAGDICYPQRFYKQVDFLNTHTTVALLGTWTRFVDDVTGKSYIYYAKTTHEAIIKEMHARCSFIHPSVMFRKTIVDDIGLYPTEFMHVEDYAYFWSILQVLKGAVLPEVLVQVCFSSENISSKNYKSQLRNRKKVLRAFGNNFIDKQAGLAAINLKLMLPQNFIQQLKYLFKK